MQDQSSYIVTGSVILTSLALAHSAFLAMPFGPGRAASLLLRSRFRSVKKDKFCVRTEQVERLRNELLNYKKSWRENYWAFTGPEGVGKTCLINTALQRMNSGVVEFSFYSDKELNQKTIIESVVKEIARPLSNSSFPENGAKRVIFWHKVFTFGRVPILVIRDMTLKKDRLFSAHLAVACKSLLERYDIRIIVEGSSNYAFDWHQHFSNGADVISVEPMTKEMIWSLPQLQKLIKVAKETKLDDLLWYVLGGIPLNYEWIWRKFDHSTPKRDELGKRILEFIAFSMRLIHYSNYSDNEILKLMESKKYDHSNDFPNEIFVRGKNGDLVPASNAIGIILRNKIKKTPNLEELEKIVHKEKKIL